MKSEGDILVVDDNKELLVATRLALKPHYRNVKILEDPTRILTMLAEEAFDVIILDMNFTQDVVSGREGVAWLKKIRETSPTMIIIMMTAYAQTPLIVETIKAGANDFIAKPFSNDQLICTVVAAFKQVASQKEIERLSMQTNAFKEAMRGDAQPMLGQSKMMMKIQKVAQKAAKTDANILILGESGTGKGVLARAIHNMSMRSEQPFISLDMGSVPATLFESELFGYKKGAFTDAKHDRLGRFQLAQAGTLFLDELANLPLSEQAKLLSVLQDKEFRPVGASQTVRVDARLIFATNESLYQSVEKGNFRQDLLYRVNTIEIALPPLRERREDIPLFADHFVNKFCKKYKKELSISESEMNKLVDYYWPGNIRELEFTIEREVIMAEGYQLEFNNVLPSRTSPASASIGASLEEFDLEEVEEKTIRRAVKHFKGNLSKAAEALGITRGALYRRLEKYEI
ncbi:sigma-54-dependent transcriptional regulator [Rheinheimera gaetbuli]